MRPRYHQVQHCIRDTERNPKTQWQANWGFVADTCKKPKNAWNHFSLGSLLKNVAHIQKAQIWTKWIVFLSFSFPQKSERWCHLAAARGKTQRQRGRERRKKDRVWICRRKKICSLPCLFNSTSLHQLVLLRLVQKELFKVSKHFWGFFRFWVACQKFRN